MSDGIKDQPLIGLRTPFATFILSLGSSAMYHLGIKSGEEQASEKNLPLAKQSIEILEMLKVKTVGNLTPEEDVLLERLLYDLRVKYVCAKKGGSGPCGEEEQ